MSRRILIADDHVPTRRALQAFLQQQGFEVLAVGNGDLAARRAGEMNPDLVVLDVLMPGKTGYEACRHIKQVLKLELPVLMIYHDGEPFDRNEALRVGADETLVKPLDPFALLETINALWRKYGRAPISVEPAELVEEVREEDVEAVFGSGPPSDPSLTAPPSDPSSSLSVAQESSGAHQPVQVTPELREPEQTTPRTSQEDESIPLAAEEPTLSSPPLPVSPLSETASSESAAPSRTPTIELPDPYSVVAAGEYAAYFGEEPVEPPTEAASEASPLVSSFSNELSDEVTIKQDIPFTDPYPSRNIFAPIPTQTSNDISFSVPNRITSELSPPDPTAGLSIHFDTSNAAVHIGGLYEVTEVELPEHATQEIPSTPIFSEPTSETLDEADVPVDGLPTEELPAEEVALLQETGTDILANAFIVAVTPPAAEHTVEVRTATCPHCGGQVLESDILCPHCGEML
jgi:DNA-binding response OmpR family regulator